MKPISLVVIQMYAAILIKPTIHRNKFLPRHLWRVHQTDKQKSRKKITKQNETQKNSSE